MDLDQEKIEALASAHASIEIANAFDGRNACFAIGIEGEPLGGAVKTRVRLLENEIFFQSREHEQFQPLFKKLADIFDYEKGAEIEIEPQIPKNIGLGYNEAVAVSIMMSFAGALSQIHGNIFELKIDKYVKEQVLEIDGEYIDFLEIIKKICDQELRFNQLFASCFGGFSVADDTKKEVLRRGEMEQLFICLEEVEKSTVDKEMFANQADLCFRQALKGNLYTAMQEHAMIMQPEQIKKRYQEKNILTTAAGKGYVAALTRKKEQAEKLEPEHMFTTKAANRQARIDQKPKRILKVNKFLELNPGDFYWV